MSLATRCTTCGTVFRVVQDQLKVSEGWVRCGRCDSVFNAVDGLFDLERAAPPDWKPPAAAPVQAAAAVVAAYQNSVDPPDDDDDDVFHLSDDDRVHSRFFQPEQEDVEQTPAQTLDARDRLDFADAQFNDALLSDAEADALAGMATLRLPSKGDFDDEPQPLRRSTPEFMRAAWRKAQWQSPSMRLALSGLASVLVCLLAVQTVFHFRDGVAARWPGLQPVLAHVCTLMNCRLELPRRINDISVESSTLSPANGGAAYKLAVVLRNHNALKLAMPSIELSLTDTAGQMVSRRALSASDFHLERAELAPNSETALQLLMSTGAHRVNGYTIEIFYP